MDDLISRQAAIDKADSLYRDTKNDECYMITGYNHAISDIRAILKSLPSAQPEQQWIPCSERLPEEDYVLISKKPSKISGDKWCVAIAIRMTDPRSGKVNWRDTGFGVIQDDKVLAWMPLPEPYKGEQE